MNQPTTIRLLGNRVLLLPLPAEERSLGGITFPANYSNPRIYQQYRVIDTGPGRRLRDGSLNPCEVKRGEYVLMDGTYEHIVFDNGARIVDASQVIAKWGEPENV